MRCYGWRCRRWMTHTLLLGDHGEEVTLVSVVHHHVDAVGLLNEAVHMNNRRMAASAAVEADLSQLETALAVVDAVSAELLDSTLNGATITVV